MPSETAERTIIVGYDGREESDDAIALGTVLARSLGAQIVLALVYPLFRPLAADSEYVTAARAEAEATLAQAPVADDVERMAVPARSAAHGLHDLATARQAQLVVVGPSRNAGLGRVVPGSVGHKLLHGSPCAVAIAPRGYASETHPLRVIEVAFDLTEESDAAVRQAVEIALAEGATIRLVAVVDPVEYGYTPLVASYAIAHADDLKKALDDRILEHVEALPSEVRADTRVKRGNVCRHILAEAEKGVDLLVMGSRGYGPIQSVFVGSIASRVVEAAPCPVLIVPRGPAVSATEPPSTTGIVSAA